MRWFRTAGVPVGYRVHRAVRAGDRARALRDWPAACRWYRAALARDPWLCHIWVQLGHALKEHGDLIGARDAYERAQLLAPRAAEPSLQIGHVRKLQGDPAAAGHHYLAALEKEPLHPEALRELRELLGRGELRDIGRAELERAGLRFPGSPRRRPAAKRGNAARAAGRFLFDVSDLVAHLGGRRHPTGIQRVQIGLVSTLLADGGGRDVRFCAYVPGWCGWCELPRAMLSELVERGAAAEAEPAELREQRLDGLRLLLGTGEIIAPTDGDIMVNPGASWSQEGYLATIAAMREEHGLRYAPFVHDLIAATRPDLCDRDVARQFRRWIEEALELADHVLVNSRATRDELLAFADRSGRPIDAASVTVVPLDADFRPLHSPGVRALERWALRPGGYVLFVGTIEPRKNHLLAFEAWERLIVKHGTDAVPPLVCVGKCGWQNNGVFARLERSGALRDRVLMLHDVSDEELAGLYGHCLFTIYPSELEGWGLPITEALCHGKIPLVPAAPALREAGGDFASRFLPGSADDLVARAEALLFDSGYRAMMEEGVRRRFRPRAWSEIAAQILDSLAPPAAAPAVPEQQHSPFQKFARLRAKGDAARDRKAWHRAIDFYSAYLGRESGDFAIWVQLGHCLKEAGMPEEALDAYGRAAALDAANADLHLQLGHVYKILGRPIEAIAAYRTSAAIDPGRGDAIGECDRLEKRLSTFAPAEARPDGLDRLIERIEAHGRAKGDVFAAYFASFERPHAGWR